MPYTVKPGDNLSTIGARLGVNWRTMTGFRSGNPNLIYPGEVITWPGDAPAAAPAPAATPAPAPAPTAPSSPVEAQKADTEAVLTQDQADSLQFDKFVRDYGAISSFYNIGDGPELDAFIHSLVNRTPFTAPTGQIVDIPGIIEYQRGQDANAQAVKAWDIADAKRVLPKYANADEQFNGENAYHATRPVSTSSDVPFQWQTMDKDKTGTGGVQALQSAGESYQNEWGQQDTTHNFDRASANQAKAGSYDTGVTDIYDQWRKSGIKGGLARQAQINSSNAWAGDVSARAQAEGDYQTGLHSQREADIRSQADTYVDRSIPGWRNTNLPTYNIHDPNLTNQALSLTQ